MPPLVSIITVTLNRPSLRGTCDSIDRQTVGDWHHYVIGDGVSPAECRHPQRSTIGFTRALGATEPSADMPLGQPDPLLRWALEHLDLGRFVCFLDDDNEYERSFLARMLEALSRSDAGIALCALTFARLRDGRPYSDYRLDEDVEPPGLDGYPAWGRCDNSGFLTYSRLARDVGFPRSAPDNDLPSDVRFLRRLAEQFGWVRVPDRLVRYGVAPNTPPPVSRM